MTSRNIIITISHHHNSNRILPESGKEVGRFIFLFTEEHRSPQTASKYRVNFNRFLDYIQIHDLDVFLDLGKEASLTGFILDTVAEDKGLSIEDEYEKYDPEPSKMSGKRTKVL
jgi:hypothetical protein